MKLSCSILEQLEKFHHTYQCKQLMHFLNEPPGIIVIVDGIEIGHQLQKNCIYRSCAADRYVEVETDIWIRILIDMFLPHFLLDEEILLGSYNQLRLLQGYSPPPAATKSRNSATKYCSGNFPWGNATPLILEESAAVCNNSCEQSILDNS